MRKVEILIRIACYRRWPEQNEQPSEGQGPGSPKQLLQAKQPSRLMLWGNQLMGWPRPEGESPDVTVPHPWGQTLEGSHVEGGLGLVNLMEIRYYQKHMGLLIPLLPFSRLVREVAEEIS